MSFSTVFLIAAVVLASWEAITSKSLLAGAVACLSAAFLVDRL